MSLNFEVDLYKNNRISELNNKYNNNRNKYSHSYEVSYKALIKSKDTPLVKNIKINKLKSHFNNCFKELTLEYNSSLAKLNSFKTSIITPTYTRALLVGINNYKGDNKLEGCKNDVSNIKKKLLSLGCFNIKTLLDENATYEKILDSLTTMLTDSISSDLIFFHYSGHGGYEIDNSLDEKNTNCDQNIVDVDLKPISDDVLKSIIAKHLKPNVTLVVLVDSCFSGSVLDLRYQYMDTLNNDNYVENMNHSETRGNVIMISGCTDMQKSEDVMINNMFQGAMTWAFLKVLNNSSNKITWRQLIINMRNNLKEKGYSQIPQISSGSIMELDSPFFI
jgi:hypothetical protein